MIIDQLLQDVILWGGALTSAGAFVGGLWWKVVNPVHRFFVRLSTGVDELQAQFRPNGGSSMADRLDGIATTQAAHGHRLRVIERKTILAGSKHDMILDDLECGYVYMDATGKNRQVNKIFCRMLNTDRESLMRYGWKNYIDEDEFERKRHHWEGAFADQRTVEFPLFMRPEGCAYAKEFWIHIVWTQVPDRFMATVRHIDDVVIPLEEAD